MSTILAMQTFVVVICTELLSRNLPIAIKRAIRANCIRLDGNWSPNRERIEKGAIWRLRGSLLFAFLLVVIPVNCGIYLLHSRVIPIPIGIHTLTAFRVSGQAFKDSLREEGVEASYDHWLGGRGPVDTASSKQRLWQYWPIIVCAGAITALLAFYFLQKAYFASLRELVSGVESRSRDYEQHDRRRLEEEIPV
jgi:hypothetical protein